MYVQPTKNRFVTFVITVCAIVINGQPEANGQKPFGDFEEYELPHLSRPNLGEIPERKFIYPEGLIPLWVRALDRDETQLSRLVIDSVSIAHQRGVEGVESLEPRLLALAKRDELSPNLAVSVANALVQFGHQANSAVLAELASKYGPSVASLVEPALAAWKSDSMETVWSERLQRGIASEAEMILAVRGIVAIGSEENYEAIRRLVLDEKISPSLRLEAARQFAIVNQEGLVDLARQLADRSATSPYHRLLAIKLLGTHTDSQTILFLNECLESSSSAVQSVAMQGLYRIKPSLVEELSERFAGSSDANVRKCIIDALADAASIKRIAPLCEFLNDSNPHLRRLAAVYCVDLASNQDLRESVYESLVAIQSREQWQGCEQATWALGTLKYLPSGLRMVKLLEHPRSDVKVAAAWGLYQLRQSEHLPAMLRYSESVWNGFQSGKMNSMMRGIDLQQALLFDSFGDQKFSQAKPLMMKYVPKNFDIGIDARVAAVWALGMLHEDSAETDLANALNARLNDDGQFPEVEDVRNMSAVSLGRMRAESALESLKKYAGGGMPGSNWALERMIGLAPPPLRPNQFFVDDWFLSPAVGSTPQD